MSKMVNCIKLGKESEAMERAPLPGELGKKILENVSQEAWDMWTKTQTMIINENRLNLADPDSRKFLQEQLKNYFFGAE